jgi:hypothetical protein
MIYVDKEGTWFHKGAPIIHRELLLFFYQSLSLDDKGRYLLRLRDQVCALEVEDTPFVILRAEFVAADSEKEEERFMLRLIDDTREVLDPQTLSVGAGHVLYCKIRGGRFTARFSRPSYYQIAAHVEEDPVEGTYFLSLNDNRYYLEKTMS